MNWSLGVLDVERKLLQGKPFGQFKFLYASPSPTQPKKGKPMNVHVFDLNNFLRSELPAHTSAGCFHYQSSNDSDSNYRDQCLQSSMLLERCNGPGHYRLERVWVSSCRGQIVPNNLGGFVVKP